MQFIQELLYNLNWEFIMGSNAMEGLYNQYKNPTLVF